MLTILKGIKRIALLWIKIIRGYDSQIYTNTFQNLDKMDKLLENVTYQNWLKENSNLDRPITIKEIESYPKIVYKSK